MSENGSSPRSPRTPDDDTGARPSPPTSGPVVISSVTGRPIDWEEEPEQHGALPRRRPILPDRVREDEPEPGADESHDARIAGDVPPHWGRGR